MAIGMQAKSKQCRNRSNCRVGGAGQHQHHLNRAEQSENVVVKRRARPLQQQLAGLCQPARQPASGDN